MSTRIEPTALRLLRELANVMEDDLTLPQLRVAASILHNATSVIDVSRNTNDVGPAWNAIHAQVARRLKLTGVPLADLTVLAEIIALIGDVPTESDSGDWYF